MEKSCARFAAATCATRRRVCNDVEADEADDDDDDDDDGDDDDNDDGGGGGGGDEQAIDIAHNRRVFYKTRARSFDLGVGRQLRRRRRLSRSLGELLINL